MDQLAKSQSIVDSLSFGEGIDFDSYLKSEEKNNIRHAEYWQEKVKDYQFNPQQSYGLKLPWMKFNKEKQVREYLSFKLRKGETTIHTGYNAHKKSMQIGFIQLGLIAQGAKCMTVSLEMPPVITLDRQIKQFAGSLEPTLANHDQFFDYVRDKLFIYDQLGTMKWKRVIGVCRYAIKEFGIDQIFLDSLMKFGIKSKDHETQAEFVDELTTLGKDTGAHIHLVAHSKKPTDIQGEAKPPCKYDISGSADLSNMVDNVIIHFQNKAEQRTYDQLLIVDKQRNPDGEDTEPSYMFTFDELQFKSYSNTPKMKPDDWMDGNFL